MVVKSTDQITMADLTDAYSVILTSESYTFPGNTSAALVGSTTTQLIAMRGAEQMNASVVLSEITKPSGVSVASDNNATSPTLTITVDTSVASAGIVKIPVHIGDIVVIKEFSFAIAFKGDTGADALTLSITSSNGLIFKNTSIATVLTAHVYKGGAEVTGAALAALGTIKWYKDGGTTAVATGQTLTIDAGDVTNKATYVAQLEG